MTPEPPAPREPQQERLAGPRRRSPAADGLYRLLRFIGRHVRGFYGAVLTYLSVSVFVGIGAAWLFAVLANAMLRGTTLSLDGRVLSWIEGHRTELLDRVALEITALGNLATLTVLVLAVSVFLWLTRHRYSVALLVIAMAGGGLLNWLLKDLFGRPRPTVVEWGTQVTTYSFPSGHAMSAAIAYGTVAYLCGRLEPTRRLRWTTWAIAGLLILAVGASRVYLGVHYPSDVVAGFIAGLGWTAFVVSGLTAVRYFAGRRPEVVEDERDLYADQKAG